MTRYAPPMLSRRAVLAGAIALDLLPSTAFGASAARAFAGTYDHEGGTGLVPLAEDTDGWTAAAALGAIRNASFGVKADRPGLRYLVDEQQQGRLGVYDRMFRRLATHSTGGSDPCHAALSPDRTTLAVANYSSGNVAVWRLDPGTGLPREEAHLVQHEGHGPNGERQSGPHAHWVGFSAGGKILHAVDLGADAIFMHRLDPRTKAIAATSIAYRAAAGSGPRHLARHPRLPLAYLVAELANTVTVLRAAGDGTFAAQAVVSTLPNGFAGSSAAAHIAINPAGTRLYVSNRGHDSIAVFTVETDGTLHLIQHIGSGGHWPRHLLILDERGEMLIANERSGTIACLRLEKDGRLRATGRSVAVPGVAFVGT